MTVSICVPCYNAAATLDITLASIVAQTYRDLDIVVLDNASTDATPDIIRKFQAQDSRVRHLRFEELVHGHDNFTRCFSAARCELMGIFHADDVFHPRLVEEEAALLDARPDIGLVFPRAGRIDDEGRPLSPFPIPRAIFHDGVAVFDFGQALRAVLQYGHIFMTPGGLARTAIYRDEIRRWPNPEFGGSADLYVFLTMARQARIAILDQTLMDYRAGVASASFRYARQRRTRHDIFQTLDHFVEKDGKAVMGPRDWANFDFLKLKDDINLATSHLIDGNPKPARALMPRLLQPRIIAAAARYGRHFGILLFGYGVWALSLIPLSPAGREALRKRRFG